MATLVVFYGLLLAAMGDCAPNPDGSGCENDGLVKIAAFPGTLIFAVVGGVLLARRMMKDKN